MKKYGFNSGYIGLDYRREEAGVISQQKFSTERYKYNQDLENKTN